WALVFIKGSNNTINTLTKTNWTFLILSGVATGLSWICYFKALQMGRVNQVAPVDKLSVAIAIVLAAIFLGESISLKTGIAAVLIISGTLVLIF
ncbi:MAG: EamA family transporter, partial [Mucilaginibacter sp.]